MRENNNAEKRGKNSPLCAYTKPQMPCLRNLQDFRSAQRPEPMLFRGTCAPKIGTTSSNAGFTATGCLDLLAATHGGGGATPRVLGRQLPLPPPPLGAFGQQLVAKGVALKRPWAPSAPDAT